MIIPLFFHFSFLAVYAVLVAALLWHHRKYSLPRDPARWVIRPFLAFSVIFAVIATILLFTVPWDIIVSGAVSGIQPQSFPY